jgi:hypothetical protein
LTCFTVSDFGDADLFLRFEEEPVLFLGSYENECQSIGDDFSPKSCEVIVGPFTDFLYITVAAYSDVINLTLQCDVTSDEETATSGPTPFPPPTNPSSETLKPTPETGDSPSSQTNSTEIFDGELVSIGNLTEGLYRLFFCKAYRWETT